MRIIIVMYISSLFGYEYVHMGVCVYVYICKYIYIYIYIYGKYLCFFPALILLSYNDFMSSYLSIVIFIS